MFDRTNAILVIEDALDKEPFCQVCDRPTTIVDEDGVLYLACPAASPDRGRLARLMATMLAHTHRLVADLRVVPAG